MAPATVHFNAPVRAASHQTQKDVTSSVSDTLSVPTYDTTHLSEPPQSSSLKAQTQGRGMRPLGCRSRTRAPSHSHPAGRDSAWQHPARCQPRHSTPSTPPTRGCCRSPC